MLFVQLATSMTQPIRLCPSIVSKKTNFTCNGCVTPLAPCRSNTNRKYSFSCNDCRWPRLDTFFIWKVKEGDGAGMVTLAAEVDTNVICRHPQNTPQRLTLSRHIYSSWLTDSMWQSPSSAANTTSASQKIPRILRTPKVRHHVHNILPFFPIKSQINHSRHPNLFLLR